MAEKKDQAGYRSPSLYLHSLTTFIILFIVLIPDSLNQLEAIIIIPVLHLLIDAAKSYILKAMEPGGRNLQKRLVVFIADQAIHIAVIVFFWIMTTGQQDLFKTEFSRLLNSTRFWGIVLCYIFLSMPVSVLIGRITQRWSDEISGSDRQLETGLKFAGKWIGIIERFLIFTFIIIGQFSGVGFLLAAKSVFRFGDLKDSSSHMKTEYIIMGTLFSFSIAIFTGLAFRFLIP